MPGAQLSVQTPARQRSPPAQTRPQAPQFATSESVSAQTLPASPLQDVKPLAQVPVQAPTPLQFSPPEHALPQTPQFLGSCSRFAQYAEPPSVPQAVKPLAQVSPQLPAAQACPAGQTVLQLPQFSPSDCRSTQVACPFTVHKVLAPWHAEAQAPAWQAWPEGQAFPQVPQFAASVWVFVQVLPQAVCPVGHAQAPAVQAWPGRHAVPQAPQFAVSVWRFEQAAPHTVCPVGQAAAWQMPPRQTSVPVQSL